MSAQKTQLKMDFSIDLSIFCETIKQNFSIIWDTLNKHNQSIQSLRSQLVNHQNMLQQPKQRKYSRASSRKMSKNFSLNYSQLSLNQQDKRIIQKNPNPQLIQNIDKQAIKLANEPKQLSQQKQIPEIYPQGNLQQKSYNQRSRNLTQDEYLKLIQEKILEMNGRLERMQLSAIKQTGTNAKKMNQINNQLQKNNQTLTKRQGQLKKLQFLIEKLRGQLSEFKLKKQAQLMKMANNGGSSSSYSNSSNQYTNIMLDKIQQISNTLPHLLAREEFDDYKTQMKPILGRIQRRVNECVSNDQFNGLVTILTRKKSDFVIGRINKQSSIKTTKQLVDKINVEQQADLATQYRLVSLQKVLKQMQSQIQMLKNSVITKTQKLNEKYVENSQKIEGVNKEVSRYQQKANEYQQFMKNMNESYNQKFKQMINQIVQVQESIQKLNNQMKFYNYAKSDANIVSGPTSSSVVGLQSGRTADLENDVNSLKKKMNKLLMKLQTIKQDILTVRQDFTRQIDALKLTLQKKCDWESLKKGMHYFQERVKDLTTYIQNIEKGANQPDETGQSTAAKKGWTCLCCDKDIKQYEGKLGEVKFTSIFPSRYQSPRIGGYYKQKEGQKQYKQIFLKQKGRLSQSNNAHNKSKQELI